ncbi:MAG: phosphopyruvate hydratase [Deltaproteobacteria bacterium]|nr:phosphopyruvate hydratase [Deltaproteobacteria bacterium]
MSNECLIRKVISRMIYDSRGIPTIEIDIVTDKGIGRNAAPFGAPGSRGIYEASAYGSVGLEGMADVIQKEVTPRLVGVDAADVHLCDQIIKEIDGSENFSRIGGNTSSALSIAIAKAAAHFSGKPMFQLFSEGNPTLPYPLGNIIGGGAHSMGAAPDMQEHLVIPVGASSFSEAVKINILVHEETGRIFEKSDPNFTGGTDDERAWTANLTDYKALEVLSEACKRVKNETGVSIRMGLDVAADRFWDSDRKIYLYERENVARTTEEQIDYMQELTEKFKLFFVEDAFQSDDYESFAELTKRVGSHCYVCGDDLLATNKERTERGIEKRAVNSMILKVNQVGTVTGAEQTGNFAKAYEIDTVISHRSGETEDYSIAHLGVAWNCAGIKTGVIGGERLAKLNELIRIEEILGSDARLATLQIIPE